MLQTKMAPASAVLKPYVWAYGMTTGLVDTAPLLVPLPARPKQLLTFSFADGYRGLRAGSNHTDSTPRVTAVGPQSCPHAGLSIFGRIDHFTIHFQPSGFNRLFGLPMTELTDAAHDAHAVIGPRIAMLDRELGDLQSFAERIRLVEKHLIQIVSRLDAPDSVAIAANSLFASHGMQRVSTMAATSGLSIRQFERRFLAQVGLPPKLYARIIKFNAVLDHKLRFPQQPWGRIASDHDYYDQMHFVHDCRAFTGQNPSRFLAHLGGLPEFHSFYATANRARRD
jgi:AraC-like DNA-binding protein